MLLTIWCIAVSIGSLYFIGLPLSVLLQRRSDDGAHWILSPFIGLSAIILILQNLVYLDVRIGLSSPWIWGSACVFWVWMAKTRRLNALFSAMPYRILGLTVVVYLAQGIGLLLADTKYYVGRAWHDQFNYTATAQFLIDHRFSLSFSDIMNQPYLFQAVSHKFDRIGQSILHGFISASTFTDAKTTFEVTILLVPPLITLAVYQLAQKLSKPGRPFLLAAGVAGILPAIAMVHLESFLSQALAIPLLLLWPYIISEVVKPT